MVPAPRIPALEPPYDPEIARTLERMMGGSGLEPLLLFRVVAHNPNVLDKFRSSGSYLLNFGTIDPIEREIVIDRTCARCRSEYEWGVHVLVYGRRVGLSDEQIRATVLGTAESPEWTERQATLIRLADELHDTGESQTIYGLSCRPVGVRHSWSNCWPSSASITWSPTSRTPSACLWRPTLSISPKLSSRDLTIVS